MLPSDYVPDKVRDWMSGLVYARDEYLDVMTMVLAVTHIAIPGDDGPFSTIGHVLATGPKGSGKSTFTNDMPEMLAFNPFTWGKSDTEPSLQHAFTARERVGALILDDVGKIYGDSGNAGKLSKVYDISIKCYRNGAKTKMSRNQVSVEVPTFTVAFMNGLHNAVPDDLWDRSIHFGNFRKAPSGYKLRDALSAVVHAEAEILKEALHSWATGHKAFAARFMQHDVYRIHPLLEQRRAQKWGPVFTMAHAAGGAWPRRIFDAFLVMELDAGERPVPVPEQKCLLDTANVLMRRNATTVFTRDLIVALRELPDGSFYRKADDNYLVTDLLPKALGSSEKVRGTMLYGEHAGQKAAAKGYKAAPLLEAAANLHDQLYPPLAPMEDEADAEMEFELL